MVNVRKCGVDRILYVSDIDVKLLLLSKYTRVLKERAALNVSQGFQHWKAALICGIVILLKLDNDMGVLTVCGVLHWSVLHRSVFDIFNFLRGHPVVLCYNIVMNKVSQT
jgi:hypothetical protein